MEGPLPALAHLPHRRTRRAPPPAPPAYEPGPGHQSSCATRWPETRRPAWLAGPWSGAAAAAGSHGVAISFVPAAVFIFIASRDTLPRDRPPGPRDEALHAWDKTGLPQYDPDWTPSASMTEPRGSPTPAGGVQLAPSSPDSDARRCPIRVGPCRLLMTVRARILPYK